MKSECSSAHIVEAVPMPMQIAFLASLTVTGKKGKKKGNIEEEAYHQTRYER